MNNGVKLALLGFFCLIISPKAELNAFQCNVFLSQPLKTDVNLNKIASIRNLIPFHRESKDLTMDEKQLIQNKISELQQLMSTFSQTYNQVFENQGTEFLADLRTVFETEDAFLRKNIQLLINELNRFLNQKGNLIYRQLDILPRIRTVSSSWGIAYLDQPKNVYFNLSFFMTSRLPSGKYQDGYIYSEDKSDDLNKQVFVLSPNSKNAETENDVFYPGSQIPIPKIDNNLVFPGLPLDTDLLEFLILHGNSSGRIQLATAQYYRRQNNILGHLVSIFQTEQRLPIFNSRWSTSRQSYFLVYNQDGTVNSYLYDLGNYFESNKHLMVPTLPVVWDQKPRGLFNKSEDELRTGLVVSEPNNAEFTVAPTPFEFLVAFTELYKPNH